MDIDYIRSSRKEIRTHRTKEVTLYSESIVGRNPVNNEPIIEKSTDDVDAVVTEVSVRPSLDRRMEDGFEIRTGDIIVDINIDDMPSGITGDDVITLDYDDKNYMVMAADKLGLGGYNRVEIIGRLSK